MMDMMNIARVRNRILEIQQQIGAFQKAAGPANFESQLQKALGSEHAQAVRNGQAIAPSAMTEQAKKGGSQAGAASTSGTAAASGTAEGSYPFGVGTGLAPTGLSSLPAADQSLASYIQSAARKYNVDPRLVSAVVQAESGGDQSAVSPVGAIGVMQLMPSTAASLGVNPYDEEQNVEGGAKYLRQLLDRFGGDVRKAVAAYNAGPAAVEAYGGVPPYAETQDYVDKVLDLYR